MSPAKIRRTINVLAVMALAGMSFAQSRTISVTVQAPGGDERSAAVSQENVVVWLVPASGTKASPPTPATARLVQKGKAFHPHLLALPVGSKVEFPNRDPFFHNVFSLFNGERFDLGLYEAGESRTVTFDRAGVSYIFCNIHPQMSAVIVSLDSPYYGVSGKDGKVEIKDVPAGEYQLHVFAEGLSAAALKSLSRSISIKPDTTALGVLRLPHPETILPHKNKYGRDYDPAQAGTPY